MTDTGGELARLCALYRYKVLDSPPEQDLDDLTALAGQLCGAPISAVSLVDSDRQWFKSAHGLTVRQSQRDGSFCNLAIQQCELFVVPDASRDDRFGLNVRLGGEQPIRFYAGAPLLEPGGLALGTLCVMDYEPRQLLKPQRDALQVVSRHVMAHLERHREASEVRETENLLRIATENARVGLVIVGAERRYIYANSSYSEILGLSGMPLVGRRVADVLPEIYATQIGPRLDRAFAGERVAYELCKPGQDGDRHYSVRYEPTENKSVVVVITDITESKRAQAQSRIFHERFKMVAQATKDAVRDWNPASRTLWWNEGFHTLFGYVEDEYPRDWEAWAEFLHPDDRERVMLSLRQAMNGEASLWSEEYRFRRRDCSFAEILDRCSMTRDADGVLQRLAGTMQDMSKRRQAEQAARRLAAIVESSDDAIIGTDLRGVITSWNAGAERMFGYSAGEVLGSLMSRLAPPEDGEAEQAILNKLALGETVREIERLGLTSRGDLVDVSVTNSPVRDEHGTIVGASKVVRDISRRKGAEVALRENRDLLCSIIDNSPSCIFVTDRQHRYRLVNESYTRFLGRPAHEILGRTQHDVFPRQVADELVAINEAIMSSGVPRQFDQVFPKHVVMTAKFPLRDARGEVTGLCGVATDITARQQAEAAQQASEARYRALFDCAPEGILICDRDAHCLEVNPSLSRTLGFPREEWIGRSLSDFVTEEQIPQLAAALNLLKAESVHRGEWQMRRRDGSLCPADVQATVMPDGNLLFLLSDVSERNRTLQALSAAEERMRFTLESSGVGIWDMDYSTGKLRWSETLESQYGLSPGRFAGSLEAFLAQVYPEDREALVETVQSAMQTGADFSLSHRVVWPDGTIRWLSGTGRIHLDGDGRPLRGVGISQDVTDQRILHAQYLQAQKMEAVGQLAGGVAHDFNNLLTVILGFSALLLDEPALAEEAREPLTEIHRAGTTAAGLTGQLLAFSRRQIVQPVVLELNAVVAAMQTMLGRLLGEDIRVVLALAGAPLHLKADRAQLEQVVMNLALNASDAMPQGGILTFQTGSEGDRVSLVVSDTGTGIAPEVQEHLFEPFFTTKEVGRGTGLGLATVHGIVSQNGGTIQVKSEVGQGTTFSLWFPRVEQVEVAASVPPTGHSPGKGQTILVVDDAAGPLGFIRDLLQRHGFKVLVADCADEALRLFATHPEIEILLTDVVMPGASGPELSRQLTEQMPALKVIYMSGYSEDAIARRGVLNPGIVLLQKPFTADSLLAKISEVCD